MKMTLQLVVEDEILGTMVIDEVACIARDQLSAETLGLALGEAKSLLAGVQEQLVTQQIRHYLAAQRHCPHCGRARAQKGMHSIRYRTLFGTLQLPSPRVYTCRCQPHPQVSESPLATLLSERSAPELRYLQTKWAGLMAYGLTVDLLTEVLPVGSVANVATLHRQVRAVAERMDQALGDEQWAFIEGCQREWNRLPRPAGPITVALDGGYVHGRDARHRKAGSFEIIVGKSMPTDHPAKCFGFVTGYDAKPKRRLFEILHAQGMQMNQLVTFLSDGGDTVRDLPLDLNPEAEHVLDWFHITMRMTVMQQLAKGLPSDVTDPNAPTVTDQLERSKWYLWHGNVFRAEQVLSIIEDELACNARRPDAVKALLKAVRDGRRSIELNAPFIPNYAERYRYGEAVSSAAAESTVNQVISKRMVKQQQMRWTKAGAHHVLQVRIAVLNDDLRATFEGWYPGMAAATAPPASAA